jgi:starch-binding outer membrane protein, SusD/RagB family
MRKLILCLSIFALISLLGCEDLLVENPKTFISSVNFYKSAGDFEAALKGLYVPVRNMALTSTQSDVFAQYSDKPEQAAQPLEIWRNNISANTPGGDWASPYSLANNANLILEGLNSIVLSADVKNKIEAEAKLLRAFAYFSLVRHFGDIPLRTAPCRSIAETQWPKSPQSAVYDLILSDLIFAESNLPDVAPVLGRVDKMVAKALLARVYLTTAGFPINRTADFALAKTKALEVITSGKFVLVDDYGNAFHKTRVYTTESIWEAFWQVPATINNSHLRSAPTGSSSAILLPTSAFKSSFPVGDRRSEWGIINGYINAKGHTIVARTYFNKHINPQFFEDELTAAAAEQAYEFNTPIIRLSEMYLIAAEAENEINGPDNAYQYINIIRNRARINKADPTHVPDLSGLSKDEFRNAVLMEREWELHLEGFAWFDMKRTQTFNKVQLSRGSNLAVPIGVYNNTFLFPQNELLNNPIEQNPIYF